MFRVFNPVLAHIGAALPRDVKRAFFMVSIFLAIKKADKPNPLLIKKINELLADAKVRSKQNIVTVGLSSMIGRYVWKKYNNGGVLVDGKILSVEELCGLDPDQKEYVHIGSSIATHVPEWLRYGTNELMISDIIHVLSGKRVS